MLELPRGTVLTWRHVCVVCNFVFVAASLCGWHTGQVVRPHELYASVYVWWCLFKRKIIFFLACYQRRTLGLVCL